MLKTTIFPCPTAADRELATRIERAVTLFRKECLPLSVVKERVSALLPEMTRPESVRPYHIIHEREGTRPRVEVLHSVRPILMITDSE